MMSDDDDQLGEGITELDDFLTVNIKGLMLWA